MICSPNIYIDPFFKICATLIFFKIFKWEKNVLPQIQLKSKSFYDFKEYI